MNLAFCHTPRGTVRVYMFYTKWSGVQKTKAFNLIQKLALDGCYASHNWGLFSWELPFYAMPIVLREFKDNLGTRVKLK